MTCSRTTTTLLISRRCLHQYFSYHSFLLDPGFTFFQPLKISSPKFRLYTYLTTVLYIYITTNFHFLKKLTIPLINFSHITINRFVHNLFLFLYISEFLSIRMHTSVYFNFKQSSVTYFNFPLVTQKFPKIFSIIHVWQG